MTTEQTAQQLELAAQILRTGHPFEFGSGTTWNRAFDSTPFDCLKGGYQVRPVLATPPDNRPLHNPDNLTAEQVGVGYRLALPGESAASPHDFWDGYAWKKAKLLGPAIFAWCCRSCRLPISVPWPEPEKPDPYAELKAAHAAGKVIQYRATRGDWSDWPKDQTPDWLALNTLWRIKPTESAKPEPAFQLPPAPPGMRWHREDGWTADDLPSGYRPCVVDEREAISGYMESLPDRNSGLGWVGATYHSSGLDFYSFHHRTTRPLTFNHAGKTWTWHRPGDPMPCDGEARIEVICETGKATTDNGDPLIPRRASHNHWDKTIGWRYTDEKKTVPLGPEDVPPGSVFRSKGQPTTTFWTVSQVWEDGFYLRGDSMPWDTARERMQINRSLSKGQWNPDAWEPCSKTIPADENLAEPKSR